MVKKQTKNYFICITHMERKQEHQIPKRQTLQKPRGMHLSYLLFALLPDTLFFQPSVDTHEALPKKHQ